MFIAGNGDFRRTIDIHRMRHDFLEGLQQFIRIFLAATDYQLAISLECPTEGLRPQQGKDSRGHITDDIDLIFHHPRRQQIGIIALFFTGKINGQTISQGQSIPHHGHIEGQSSDAGINRTIKPQGVDHLLVGHSGHIMCYAAMGEHNALGAPRGTGRIDEVGNILLTKGHMRLRIILFLQKLLDVQSTFICKPRKHIRRRNDKLGLGILNNHVHPFRWISRVKGNIAQTCLAGTIEGKQRSGCAGQENQRPVSDLGPPLNQGIGHPVGNAVKFAITKRSIYSNQRRTLRVCRRKFLHVRKEEGIRGNLRFFRYRMETIQQKLLLFIQQRNAAQPCFAIFGKTANYRAAVPPDICREFCRIQGIIINDLNYRAIFAINDLYIQGKLRLRQLFIFNGPDFMAHHIKVNMQGRMGCQHSLNRRSNLLFIGVQGKFQGKRKIVNGAFRILHALHVNAHLGRT